MPTNSASAMSPEPYKPFQVYEVTLTKGKKVGLIKAAYVRKDDKFYYFVNVSNGKEVKIPRC